MIYSHISNRSSYFKANDSARNRYLTLHRGMKLNVQLANFECEEKTIHSFMNCGEKILY